MKRSGMRALCIRLQNLTYVRHPQIRREIGWRSRRRDNVHVSPFYDLIRIFGPLLTVVDALSLGRRIRPLLTTRPRQCLGTHIGCRPPGQRASQEDPVEERLQ